MKSVVIVLLLTFSGCILVSPQFTEDEIAQILERINTVRRNAVPTGSNLREVMWSDCLADISAGYLSNCPGFGEQNQEREAQAREIGCVESDVSVGETRFNGASGAANPVDVWASESSNYNFETNTCQGECSNYLQLVNAETFVVGCAKLDEVNFCGREGESTVCNYGFAPDGSVPYETGEACGDCEGEFSGCNEGLCIETPVVTRIPATTSTTDTPTCPNRKDHRHDHHHGHKHGHKHGHTHRHKNDNKPHRHENCGKKHKHNEAAEFSVENFADVGYNNSATNTRVMIFLLIGSIIAILLSIL